MKQYIQSLYESILSEAMTLSSSETASDANVETALKDLLKTDFVSIQPDEEKQLQVVLSGKYDGITLRVDTKSSAASDESTPKSIYTMNTYYFENGRQVTDKPVALATALNNMLRYDKIKASTNIKIDSNAQHKAPADNFITTGKNLVKLRK